MGEVASSSNEMLYLTRIASCWLVAERSLGLSDRVQVCVGQVDLTNNQKMRNLPNVSVTGRHSDQPDENFAR